MAVGLEFGPPMAKGSPYFQRQQWLHAPSQWTEKGKASLTVLVWTVFISQDVVSTLKAEAASCQKPSTVHDPP